MLGKFGGLLGRFGLQDMFERTAEKMLQSIPDQAQQAILRNQQRVDTLREELALLEQKLQALHATGEGEKP